LGRSLVPAAIGAENATTILALPRGVTAQFHNDVGKGGYCSTAAATFRFWPIPLAQVMSKQNAGCARYLMERSQRLCCFACAALLRASPQGAQRAQHKQVGCPAPQLFPEM